MGKVLRGSLANGRFMFKCPGCGDNHVVPTQPGQPGPVWAFSGTLERPTFSPSILVTSGHYVSGHRPGVDTCWCEYRKEHPDLPENVSCYRCHSFVRDGQIQFLGDCTHKLAGQTVPLPSVE